MSKQEQIFFEPENNKEKILSDDTQHYERAFYPTSHEILLKKNGFVLVIIVSTILTIFSAFWASLLLNHAPSPYGNNPWPIFGLFNIFATNFIFYLLLWQIQRKMVYK